MVMDYVGFDGQLLSMDEDPKEMYPEQLRMYNIVKSVREAFDPEEAEEIVKYLGGFNIWTIEVIARIILSARKKGRSFHKITKAFKKELNRNWKNQPVSAFRGDPYVVDAIGRRNRRSLNNMCCALGIPLLEFPKKSSIPDGPFMVQIKSAGSHRFSKKMSNGTHRMTYVSKSLRREVTETVRVLKLVVGQNMVITDELRQVYWSHGFMVTSVDPKQTS